MSQALQVERSRAPSRLRSAYLGLLLFIVKRGGPAAWLTSAIRGDPQVLTVGRD